MFITVNSYFHKLILFCLPMSVTALSESPLFVIECRALLVFVAM